jgi:hypothetical protein
LVRSKIIRIFSTAIWFSEFTISHWWRRSHYSIERNFKGFTKDIFKGLLPTTIIREILHNYKIWIIFFVKYIARKYNIGQNLNENSTVRVDVGCAQISDVRAKFFNFCYGLGTTQFHEKENFCKNELRPEMEQIDKFMNNSKFVAGDRDSQHDSWSSYFSIIFENLRGYWSLELNFLDKILANQIFKDIIQISQFVELAYSLREQCAKTFLHAYTPWHISDTRRHKPKRKNYLLLGFILKSIQIPANSSTEQIETS